MHRFVECDPKRGEGIEQIRFSSSFGQAMSQGAIDNGGFRNKAAAPPQNGFGGAAP
jgi:hypothetical protein